MSVMPPSPAMPQLRLSAAFILLLLINFLSSLAPVNGLYISSLTYCNKPHHHHHNICRHIIAKPMTRHRSDPFEKERVKRAKNVKRDLTKILLAMEEWNQAEDSVLADLLQKWHDAKQQKKAAARNRKCRQRRSWEQFQQYLTDRQFRRYFRMERGCFDYLCERIIDNVGEREFKSEIYLRDFKNGDATEADTLHQTNILHAHERTTGGFVSGEVKLALTLRLLAGGSYMDLALLFDVGFSTAYEIFHKVIKEWILDDRLVKINGVDYCEDDKRMEEVARGFAVASKNVINGCIGAIDGWIVKIRKPRRWKDLRGGDPATFFSRKGFFGINVQAIVDRKKRILYRNIIHRGAEHDSTAFKHSNFYEWLEKNWKKLAEKGLYFIGDSAYAIKSFLVTPFDNAVHGTPEDNYNFFHSSSRISVECAFGEIDLRWGILWSTLRFSLAHNVNVIDACMRLHNFIVDWREDKQGPCRTEVGMKERDLFEEDHRKFMAAYPDIDIYGVHGGEEDDRRDSNGNPLVGGRPSNLSKALADVGRKVRDTLCKDIESKKLVRPKINWFRHNNRVVDEVHA